jgi:hypothetical protein
MAWLIHTRFGGIAMRNRATAILILVGLLSLDLIASSVYYNWVDHGIGQIRDRFENGERGQIVCDGNPADQFTGRPNRSGQDCSGGILQERDAYLAKHHVFGMGDWRYEDGAYWTSMLYFRYWF